MEINEKLVFPLYNFYFQTTLKNFGNSEAKTLMHACCSPAQAVEKVHREAKHTAQILPWQGEGREAPRINFY